MDLDTTIKRLRRTGFEQDDTAHAEIERIAEENGMHANGPYKVLHLLVRGDVRVLIEQNTDALATYEPVAVVEGPNGRVACDPSDTDLLLTLVDEVS